ncbi:hypothetical protein FG877_10620 [Enterococcus casseliflavus]|nr:hypothetical protein [Enterococcus casseliflavus]
MNKMEFYLSHFDMYFEDLLFLEKYPKINLEYKLIRQKFFDVSESSFVKDPLLYISEILDIDAQLQILYELCQCIEYMSLNEEEVISMAEKDSKYYYLESFGKSKNDPHPHSVLFIRNLDEKLL